MKLKRDRRRQLVDILDLAIQEVSQSIHSGEGLPTPLKDAHTVLANHLKLRWSIDKQERAEVRLGRADLTPGDDTIVIRLIDEVSNGLEEPEQLI